MTQSWRKLDKDEIFDKQSGNIITVIITKLVKWAGNMVHMGEKRKSCRLVLDIFKERGH